jgi:FAD/FMN-containing dehydrogenase
VSELKEALQILVPGMRVLGPVELAGRDPGWEPGNLGCSALASPRSTAEVGRLVAWCRAQGVGIVPQGGRTGLVGGAVSGPGEVVIASDGLATIEEVDPLERVAVVGAGVSLGALQEAAARHGLEPGIDLAARGTATIGGMISTNAGGILAFRNGVMRHRVLGLEAVLPDGRVFSDMTRVVKTSAGYDLKHLFIGAEGTLGIITRAVLKLDMVSGARASALIGVKDATSALRIVRHFLALPGQTLCGAELMWQAFAAATSQAQGRQAGQLPLAAPAHLVLDIAAETSGLAVEALEKGIANLWGDGQVVEAVVAQSLEQRDRIWALREDTDAIYRLHPQAPSYDLSVPARHVDAYVARITAELAKLDATWSPYVFGHIADGNLHVILNVAGPLPAERAEKVEDVLYLGLAEIGGCFSAEHGIGKKKKRAFAVYADPVKRELASAIKDLLDPARIANPSKLV